MSRVEKNIFGGNSPQRKWAPMNSWHAADATTLRILHLHLHSPLCILHSAFCTRHLGRRFQNSPAHTIPPPSFSPIFRPTPTAKCRRLAAINALVPVFLSFSGKLLLIPCYCCKLFMHFEVYLKHEQQQRNSLHGISNAVRDSHSVDLLLFVDFMNCFSCFTCSRSGALPSGHIWSP